MQLIMSLAYMMRANDESETKSQRAKAKILKRKKQALEGHKRYNPSLVNWIDQIRVSGDDYEFVLNDHAKTVQRIYELADSGIGTHSIARILNQSDTPVFKPKINRMNRWRDATVSAILRDETCIGTYKVFETVEGERVPLGEPIKNYYPAAISEELFWRVQRKRPEHPLKGRVGKRYANLFPRMAICSNCGGALKMLTNRNQKAPRNYFTCSNRVLTGGKACNTEPKTFRYDELEAGILTYVSDFHQVASEALENRSFDLPQMTREIAKAQTSVLDVERRIGNLREDIETEDDSVERAYLRKRLADLRGKREQLVAHVAELQKQIDEVKDQRQQMATVTERIAVERLSWSTGTDEEVLQSRSRVSKALSEFITLIKVYFEHQAAIVEIAGGAKGYVFNRDGHLIDMLDMTDLPFEQFEAGMKMDGKTIGEISQAKAAYSKIKAAG